MGTAAGASASRVHARGRAMALHSRRAAVAACRASVEVGRAPDHGAVHGMGVRCQDPGMGNESRRSASVAAGRRWAVEGSASVVRKPVAALRESIHAAGLAMSGMSHSLIPPNPGMARMEFLLGIPSRSGRGFFVSLRRREPVRRTHLPLSPSPLEGRRGDEG